MLTDAQLQQIFLTAAPEGKPLVQAIVDIARAVEAEAREDADECIAAQEDMLRELRAERDALRADIVRYANAHEETARLIRADRDQYRRDAERYRLLRNCFMRQTAWDRYDGAMWDAHIHDPKCVGIDAVIDAALAKEGK